MDWPLQDAKNRFSEMVQRARREGPRLEAHRASTLKEMKSPESRACGLGKLLVPRICGVALPGHEDFAPATHHRGDS